MLSLSRQHHRMSAIRAPATLFRVLVLSCRRMPSAEERAAIMVGVEAN